MMKKNGFSRCAEMYIGRLRKKRGAILLRMCMKMHFFLLEGFVAHLPCHSDK